MYCVSIEIFILFDLTNILTFSAVFFNTWLIKTSCNASSSGISSGSRAEPFEKGRLNEISFNDGSYLAIEKNMKLRSRKSLKIKKCIRDSRKSRENIILSPHNEFHYCSAEDSAIHHELCFENETKRNTSFKTEVF